MIKNYLKIAFRGFGRNKLFTLINVTGLSIGISAAVVIYLIVHFDFTFDKFHKGGDRIYRIVTESSFAGKSSYNSGVYGPLPEAVKSQVTGVDAVAPFLTLYTNVVVPGATPVRFKNQDEVILADERYFNLFQYHWLAGSAKTALSGPNQLVLTSNQAKLYFSSIPYEKMLGKQVFYDSVKTTVTGIVETLKEHTDFTFHDFISYSTGTSNQYLKDQLGLTSWGNITSASQLFIKLSPQTAAAHIEKQLNVILKRNVVAAAGNKDTLKLQPLNDLHFNALYGTFNGGTAVRRIANNNTTVYGLLAVALFLLLLACINFINLTTAQTAQRAKEIGIRKTLGSTRVQLVLQFLSETFFVTLFAVIVSVALSPVMLKLFADFIPAGVAVDLFHRPDLAIFLLLLTLTVSILSGFYPALVLSGYKPIAVLKNQAQINYGKTSNAWLRKSLTITQFFIAQFFIMASMLVGRQIYHALHRDLGFKKDAIIFAITPYKDGQALHNVALLNKLRSIPQIELISQGQTPPSSNGSTTNKFSYIDGKKEVKTDVDIKFGDGNYIKLYKIKLLAGRNLLPADTGRGLLINKTYANLLGFKSSSDAVGNYVTWKDKKQKIIGVVGDFYQKSLHAPIKPVALLTGTASYQSGIFHIALKPQTDNGGEWKTAITLIGRAWRDIYPDEDFEYRFFDDSIAKFYESEQHLATLLTWATALSVFISCLGLFGLAIYTTNQRTKEIGIRKVLGATVTQIVVLLSSELVWLVILAFILAVPVTLMVMNRWMQNFVDRAPVGWGGFILSGAGMLVVAMITSGFKTLKAAIANPVKSLRSE